MTTTVRLDPLFELSAVPDLTVAVEQFTIEHPEPVDAETIRAYRAGTLVGVVDLRDGRVTYAEHCGRTWHFWPTDSRYRREEKIEEWRRRVREYRP